MAGDDGSTPITAMSVVDAIVADERTSRMVAMTKPHVGHMLVPTTAGRHVGYLALFCAADGVHAVGESLGSPWWLGSMPHRMAGPPRRARRVRVRPPAESGQAAAVDGGSAASATQLPPPSALATTAGAARPGSATPAA